MSHPQQIQYIKNLKEKFTSNFVNVKVLEIGSLNINGSVRSLFEDCDYLGIDVGMGPGVDLVCEGQTYDAPDNIFDTVISCECFEHNPYWLETFKNMVRMCKLNGLIIFTCATTGRKEHGTTKTSPKDSPLTIEKGWDYYKNLTEEDFTKVLNINNMFSSFGFSVNNKSHDLYFWGVKR